jgi:RNA polymerase sigma factor (sigma-70 family)
LEEHPPSQVADLTEQLFRHEAGRMVAVLTRIFGFQNLELVEDVVQDAFAKALTDWTEKVPDNPSAWLMQTAKHKTIDLIRRKRHQQAFSAEFGQKLESEYTAAPTLNHLFLDHEIQDSQLRMIFACCHPALQVEDQILLTLKTCSGFGVEEAAHALLMQYEAAKKRLQRAKAALVEQNIALEIPTGPGLGHRLDIALRVLYLMFNEGYKSSTQDQVIRGDMCREALRLCILLSEHPLTSLPQTHALLALMCFQVARFDARIDSDGDIVLLEDQDRSRWDPSMQDIGLRYLNLSAEGETLSSYHLQAAIAYAHLQAKSFAHTNWTAIHGYYEQLAQLDPSPMVLLNKAIVLSRLGQATAAMAEFEAIPKVKTLLTQNYLFAATKAELHQALGEMDQAKSNWAHASRIAPTAAERRLMARKMEG